MACLHSYYALSRRRRRVTPIPIDNLSATGCPHALVTHHVPERLVEKTNPERLADEPGVQVEDEEPAILFAVPIQNVKTLLEQLTIAVNGHTPLPEGVNIVQFKHEWQGVQFSLRCLHGVRLLVVHPVAHIADARLRQQLWRTGRLAVLRPQPTQGSSTGGALQGVDCFLDIRPLLLL